MGAAEEATGDLLNALKRYDEAAAIQSTQRIVVSENRSWRGKAVSQMAAESARALRSRIQGMDPAEVEAMMLTIRGVEAANHNNWAAAREDFLKAYDLQPQSAFAINNAGYVAERDGDLETASSYYALAKDAADAKARVGLATQSAAQGQRLDAIAGESQGSVDAEQEAYREQRRRREGPIKLIPRNNIPDNPEPGTNPPSSSPATPSPAQPSTSTPSTSQPSQPDAPSDAPTQPAPQSH